MSEKITFEQIEAYLAGNLLEEDVKAIELLLQADASFAQEVEAQKAAHQAVHLFSRITLKEKVKQLHKESSDTRSFRIEPKVSLLLAAIVLVLITISSIWYGNRAYSNDALIASNYTPPPFNSRLAGGVMENLYQQIGNAYASQNYLQAIELLDSLPSSTQKDYLKGAIYLEIGSTRDAIIYLRRAVASGSLMFTENAQWALVMAHLQDNDENQANSQLDMILENPNHSLHDNAVKLKKKLNSFWHKLASITSK